MKFASGDSTDVAHCIVLKHEALRMQEAFEDFAKLATQSIMAGENRALAFTMYNAYARFVLHLYEFMVGALVRDEHDTGVASGRNAYILVERYIAGHTQRILSNRRESVINRTAPSWENDLSAFPEKIPADFAADFRRCRNRALGHVDYERAELNLSEFYDRYHSFLHMLYRNVLGSWGRMGNEFPDLKEITDFTVAIREHPPSAI